MKIRTLVIYLIPFFLKKSKKIDRCDRTSNSDILINATEPEIYTQITIKHIKDIESPFNSLN